MTMEVLKIGSKGYFVKILQGLLGATIDGVFGKMTESLVKKFQTDNKLTVDGVVGNKTWEKLGFIFKPLSVHVTQLQNRPIKYLSIHFTAGSNSKPGRAQATYNTFTSGRASADFCVDDMEIVQFNPDIKNYYCWAVGDKKYNNTCGGTLYGKATNKNTISIEICSTCIPPTKIAVNTPNHEGWLFTESSLKNALKLARILMKIYNIPLENVVRHYDISGKLCPGIIGWNKETLYDVETGKPLSTKNTEDKWIEFKNKLK